MAEQVVKVAGNALAFGDLGQLLDFLLRHAELLVDAAPLREVVYKVTFTRRLNPGTPTVGESFEEAIEVRRRGWVPAPWVEVRDLSQIPDYQPGRVISVSGEVVKWKSRGVYRRRGWMAFGPTSLRVREPFGLFNREQKLTQRTSVLVYPRVRPIPDLLTPSAQQVGNSPSFGAWADYPRIKIGC